MFILSDMTRQLVLIDDSDRIWALDPHTRELGRQGVAAAREVLRQAAARRVDRPEGEQRRAA